MSCTAPANPPRRAGSIARSVAFATAVAEHAFVMSNVVMLTAPDWYVQSKTGEPVTFPAVTYTFVERKSPAAISSNTKNPGPTALALLNQPRLQSWS